MQTKLSIIIGIAAVFFAVTLFAHHGTSISYEMDKTITVTGTLRSSISAFPTLRFSST